MASRDSLKSFQARLANRLQAAQTGGSAASWLAVDASGLRVLLPLSHAGEIFSWSEVKRVPYVQSWFMGVANLRGVLNGVIDLGGFLGQAASTSRDAARARLVGLNPLFDVNAALLVDGLLGLKTVDAFAESMAPDSAAPEHFGHAYIDTQGERWQEINLQKLTQSPDFLAIST